MFAITQTNVSKIHCSNCQTIYEYSILSVVENYLVGVL